MSIEVVFKQRRKCKYEGEIMKTYDLLWDASLQDVKRGYREEEDKYTCLLCGKETEKGIIYHPHEAYVDAEKAIVLHIEETHGSVFDYLLHLDKKYTGVTEHQKKLLELFHQGKKDKEIQDELGNSSTSTIRHHRYALKEKEHQAKNFLAIMELLNKGM